MKNFLRFPLCLGLYFSFWVVAGGAQQQQPQQPTAPPPSNPLDRKVQAPPTLPPKAPDVRQPGETGWWVGLSGWFPTQQPVFDKGHGATFDAASQAVLPGKPKLGEQIDVGMALGLHNALRLSYFETKAAGNFTPSNDLHLWNQDYAAGTYLSSNYRLQSGKISFDFLTWPYPVESRKFRLKTLWQVQYTNVRTSFDSPFSPVVDSNGLPILDAGGNPISYLGEGSKWFISPEVGLGVAYYSGRHFRLEANAAGFAIPHHNAIWDADASANFRYGHFELRVGAKGFHFKTSTKDEFFTKGTLGGAFVGVRWYSN